MKSPFQTLKISLLVAVLFLGATYASAAWTPPAQAPTGGNTPAPLNVGNVDQVKNAGLSLDRLLVNGQFRLNDGTQGAGKVLVSDADGVASWQDISGGNTTVINTPPPTGPLSRGFLAGHSGTSLVGMGSKIYFTPQGVAGVAVESVDVTNPDSPTASLVVAPGDRVGRLANVPYLPSTDVYSVRNGNHLYVLSDGAIDILDISDPVNTRILKKQAITVGSGPFTGGGVRPFLINGDYLYILVGPNILKVYQISSPTSPVLKSTYTLGVNIPSVQWSINFNSGHQISVYNGDLYALGGSGTGKNALEIINISNPASLSRKSLLLFNDFYHPTLADFPSTDPWNSNQTITVSEYSVANSCSQLGNISDVVVLAGKAYVKVVGGCLLVYKSTGSNRPALSSAVIVLDISNPATPSFENWYLIDNLQFNHPSANSAGYFPGVFTLGGKAYTFARHDFVQKGVPLVDLSDPAGTRILYNNPSNPGNYLYTIVNGVNNYINTSSGDIYYNSPYGYFALQSFEVKSISSATIKATPNAVNKEFFKGPPRSIDDAALSVSPWGGQPIVKDGYVFLVSGHGIDLWSNTNPSSLIFVKRFDNLIGGAKNAANQKIITQSGYVYSVGSELFSQFDSNLNYKSKVTQAVGGAYLASAADADISGDYAYVIGRGVFADYSTGTAVKTPFSGLEIINISNKDQPVHIGKVLKSDSRVYANHPTKVFADTARAYVVNLYGAIVNVINVSDKANPTYLTSSPPALDPDFYVKDAARSGNYIYLIGQNDVTPPSTANESVTVPTNKGSLLIVNMSNPSTPVLAGRLDNGVTGAFLTNPNAISISGNYAFITDLGSNSLEIVDVTNPSQPKHHWVVKNGDLGAKFNQPKDVLAFGNYLYITSADGLQVLGIGTVLNKGVAVFGKNNLASVGSASADKSFSWLYSWLFNRSKENAAMVTGASLNLSGVGLDCVPKNSGSVSALVSGSQFELVCTVK